MKNLILFCLLVICTIGFSQNNKLKNRFIANITKDSIYYFPVWEIKNKELYSIFDKVIKKNKKCLQKKRWDQIGNDYFFIIGIYNYSNTKDSCKTFKVNITSHAGTELIKTFIMSYGDMSYDHGPYSGVIIYKNEIFMIWNNPKINNLVPFISKTNDTQGISIGSANYINIDKYGTIIAYTLEYEYLYKNDRFFKLLKKGCCP